MTLTQSPVSRRTVLKAAGLGAAGVLFAGNASATTGRYIVGTSSPRATRAAVTAADGVHRVLNFGRYGQAVAGKFSRRGLRGLAARPDVRYVEVDGLMHANAIDDTDGETDWGVDRVDAEKAWSTKTGSGVHVAILDTGIDYDHPDLASAMGESISFAIRSPNKTSSTDPADYDDGNGHGTHCAGIAAAIRDGSGVVGVGQGATLHAVKVLHDNGSGSYSDVAAGIEWVANKKSSWGTAVASLSLGGPLSDTIKTACQYAYDQGVLIVAAAGNDGADVADTAPAAYPTVVAVSATNEADGTPSWSNYGDEIELAAPGVGIYSTYKGGGYDTLSGTSMACPHVSGGAALAWATLGTSASNVDVRSHLQTTAEDLGATGRDTTYGYGLLDAETVVTGSSTDSGSTDTTAPAAPTNLRSPAQRETEIDLAWDASTDDLGVAGYRVYQDGATTPVADVTTLAATVTGLAEGTSYTFEATAYDAAGNESDRSAALTVSTTSSSTGALAIASFTATSLSSKNPHVEVSMDWESTGATAATLALTSSDGTIDESWNVATTGSKYFEQKHASPKSLTATLTVTDGSTSVSEVRTLTA